ncbi:MAG TPA: hypothetical protein VFE28_14225 [Candidatus Krumholzibacteria bacterium]|nr:hypothetical protein [Candidatus Krumholzibacteria bacterium]
MTASRWSIAAVAVYGGLLLLAGALFALLTVVRWLEPGQSGAAIYWLIAVPVIVACGTWLLLVVWCAVDAGRRGMSGPLWGLLVFLLGFPVGPVLYLVLRRSPSAPENNA